MYWLTLDWWRYLLERKDGDVTWCRAVLCRIKGHPYPVRWYSSGLEPDMHCQNCGDDLG